MRLPHEQVSFSLRASRFTSLYPIEPEDLFLAMRSPNFLSADGSFSLPFLPGPGDAAAHPPAPAGQLPSPFPCVSTFVLSPMFPHWTILGHRGHMDKT